MIQPKSEPGSPSTERSGRPLAEVLAGNLPPDTLCLLLDRLKKQWKLYRKGLKKCQSDFYEPAVHYSRVATRRLLSILELLGPFLGRSQLETARRALKRHLDIFDDLRDTHVQLMTVTALKRRFPVGYTFEEYLLKRERRFTKRTGKEVRWVRTKRLGRLIEDWRERIRSDYADAPRDTCATLLTGLQNAFDRTVELKSKIHPEDTATIHRTRVAFKRYRYMSEILTGFVPGSRRQLLASMHDYQTLMGEIQDAEVLLEAFEKFVRKRKVQSGAAAAFREELVNRRRSLVERYLSRAARIENYNPRHSAGRRRGHPARKLVPQARPIRGCRAISPATLAAKL